MLGCILYGTVLNFLWRSMHSWVHFFTEQYAKRYDDFDMTEQDAKWWDAFYTALYSIFYGAVCIVEYIFYGAVCKKV